MSKSGTALVLPVRDILKVNEPLKAGSTPEASGAYVSPPVKVWTSVVVAMPSCQSTSALEEGGSGAGVPLGVRSGRQVAAHAVALGVDAVVDQGAVDGQDEWRILLDLVDDAAQGDQLVRRCAAGERVDGGAEGGRRGRQRRDVGIREQPPTDDIRADRGRQVGTWMAAAPAHVDLPADDR